jgi:hypothetical protein
MANSKHYETRFRLYHVEIASLQACGHWTEGKPLALVDNINIELSI